MKPRKVPDVPKNINENETIIYARIMANIEFDILTMENQKTLFKKTNHLNKLIRLQPRLDEYLKLIGKK